MLKPTGAHVSLYVKSTAVIYSLNE